VVVQYEEIKIEDEAEEPKVISEAADSIKLPSERIVSEVSVTKEESSKKASE
jgi:hypothetical protein